MSADVLRAFAVSLGYTIDKNSERSFNESLKQTAENAVKLGLAIEAAAAAVTGAVVKMAQGMEKTYYASKRLGASVKDINAMEHAITQVGGSADGARSSMEALARFTRNNPGGKNYLKNMLGSSVDVNNSVAVMGALSKTLSKMAYPQALARAQMLGIDEDTLQAMLRDGGRYYEEYQKLVKKAGVDQDKYAKDSQQLMVKVRDLGASFSVLGMKVGSALISKSGPYIDRFKAWIDKNFESITNIIVRVTDAIFRFSEAISRGINHIIEWYDRLDPKSKDMVKTIAAIAGSVWLLNKAFGASPIGIILSLATALVGLYQDYQHWKETGEEGLIDWKKWGPAMESAIEALKTIGGWIASLSGDGEGGVGALQIAFTAFAAYMATKWATSLLSSFAKVKLGYVLLAAYIANDLMKTPEQKLQDMRDTHDFIDKNVNNSTLGKFFGRASNAVRSAFGMDKKFNADGSRSAGGQASKTAGGGELVQIKTPSGKTAMVAKEHQEQFQGFVDDLEKSGYKINDLGGYANRQNVNNPGRKSEHSHGAAIDINPSKNPNGTRTTDIPVELGQALAKKWGLGWGLNWKSTGDPMHFSAAEREGGRIMTREELDEIKGKPTLAALAKKAQSLPSLPALKPDNAPYLFGQGAPLLPNTTTNNSTSNMSMKTEITIMGSADATQVGNAVEAAGNRLSQRNVQTAIR